MKKITLLSILLLTLAVATALAGGIDLVWNDHYGYGNGGFVTKWACWSDFGKIGGPVNPPTTDYNSPCDAETEYVGMMCSFKLDAAMPDFCATTVVLDGATLGVLLWSWWEMWNPGSCRPNTLTADAAFSPSGAYQKGCLDPYAGNASAQVIAYESPMFPAPKAGQSSVTGPNTFRTKAVTALATPVALNATNEYYGCGLTITFEHTVDGTCPGCLAIGKITLNEILVEGVTSPSQRLQAALHSRTITWHSGLMPGLTPAINETWGQVKSLYR